MKRMLKTRWVGAAILVAASVTGVTSTVLASNWWEDVKLKGDLRYRHEMIDKEDADVRHRHRLRARIGVFGQVSQYMNVGVQLATGSDDPVSTNQTLDGAFSTKQVGVDLAYFEAKHAELPGFRLTGGKFKNPFFKTGKSELVWDSDWNPEGGVLTFTKDYDKTTLTLLGSGMWIDERSSGKDSYLASAQGVLRYNIEDKKSSIAAGASYFNYENVSGFNPFHDTEDPLGNSVAVVSDGDEDELVYTTEYDLLELFAEFNHTVSETPVTVMIDYVSNTAADSLDTGWLVGFRVGKMTKPGSWAFRYNYREVEKDAVVGIFTDSDFRGGGTDAKGHEIGGSLQLAEGTAFNVTYFINEIGLEEDETEDFGRLQVDLQLKF